MFFNQARPGAPESGPSTRVAAATTGAAPNWDAEALARAAGERLARGDGAGAFALADRRCRLIVPNAQDLFLRAQAHRAAGRLDAAQHDLAAALALDPTDALIDRAALAWGDEPSQLEAAERIVVRAGADWPSRRKAAELMFAGGVETLHDLRRGAGGVSGWIAWAGEAPLRIEIAGGDSFEVDPDPDHSLAVPGHSAADVFIEVAGAGPLQLRLVGASGETLGVDPAPAARPRARPLEPRPASPPSSPFVTIVVPVYEDYEATRACLEALRLARPAFDHRIVVIDDASPNAELKAWIDAAAERGEFELLRNESNAGFAAAVNRALAARDPGDALLLNADALLPPGAVDRLHALSRSQPDIGAVTPFSNNGELTSWPRRNEANPMPSAEEIAGLDALARAANGDALVDIPNGIGFCLYITQACLDAVGGLPELYAQGYYEDVEFCLAAREQGFRNVAAPGVYVGHAGSRSFGARKRALVARNLMLIESRFPGYRLETAAFVALDPLKPYRAALDAATPPEGPLALVACGPGAAAALGRRYAQALAADGRKVLTLTARGETIELAAIGEGAPQSLAFDFARGEAVAFAAWLARLEVARVEWFDPSSLPEDALAPLLALGAPGDLHCGALDWFSPPLVPRDGPCADLATPEPCAACRERAAPAEDPKAQLLRRYKLGRALEGADLIAPLDRLSESFALRVFKSRVARLDEAPPPAPRAGPIRRIAALYPHSSARGDRLLLRLGRALALRDAQAELIVFGATLDDSALMGTSRVYVAGPVAPSDYATLAGDYGVDALFAPDRGGGYGDLEATAAALSAPKVYFDWSFGAFPVEWGDLSLDPRICDDKAASEIVAWANGERRT